MVYVVDSDANRIVKLSSKLKVLAQWGGYGIEPGQFIQPQGIAVDAHGDIYVADTGNARIQKLAPDGSVLAVWQGSTLRNPLAIKVDGQGSVFVLDNGYDGYDRVYKFSSTFHLLSTWDLSLFGGATFGVDLAVDKAGHPYVADQGNGDIIKLSASGQHPHPGAASIWLHRHGIGALPSGGAVRVGVSIRSCTRCPADG